MKLLYFRAWDKVKKVWIEKRFSIIGEVTVFDMLKQYSIEQFNDIEVTQYIGLKDRQGIEICEGDIVEQYVEIKGERGDKFFNSFTSEGTVKFDLSEFKYIINRYGGYSPFRVFPHNVYENGKTYNVTGWTKVIGNIYENEGF